MFKRMCNTGTVPTTEQNTGSVFSGTYTANGCEVSYTLVWTPISDKRLERRLRYQFMKRRCSVHKSRKTGLYWLVDEDHTDFDYGPWHDLTLQGLQDILQQIVENEGDTDG